MVIDVFTLAVGEFSWKSAAKEVLEDYCKYHNLRLTVIEEDAGALNSKKAHPSWWKLFAFKLLPKDASFVICWDLDLLPKRRDIPPPKFSTGLINVSLEPAVLFYGFKGPPNFLYNMGFFGYPRCEAEFFQSIYDKYAPGNRDCWEQFYVNDEIAARKTVGDLHTIPAIYNTSYPMNNNPKKPLEDSLFVHYTWAVLGDCPQRKSLIDMHRNNYFGNI